MKTAQALDRNNLASGEAGDDLRRVGIQTRPACRTCHRLRVITPIARIGVFARTVRAQGKTGHRSEEHPSELPALMRIPYAVYCLKKKKNIIQKLMKRIRHVK